MMNDNELKNADKDELIEYIETLRDKIDEQDFVIEDLNSDIVNYQCESEQYEEVDKSAIAEAAFNAGYEAKDRNDSCMRSFLNYKIEARL